MASTLQLFLFLGMLALCLANPVNNIRWCVRSGPELKKCSDVSRTCGCEETTISCVLKVSNDDCYKAISEDKADAMSLDSAEIYKASLQPYNLRPVAAENYGTKEVPDTCYYSVALVKDSSTFMFKDLKGKQTCHTAVGRGAGWISPVGTLISLGIVPWSGPESQSVEKAFALFVSGACAPGAKVPNLCSQCAGKQEKKCKPSHLEPYYGYSGACLCLKDDKGEVAFVKHLLPEGFREGYQLLCLDNTRKPVDQYEKCYWAKIPGHGVVTADKEEKVKLVTRFLEEAQKKSECKLFSSPHGTDLMFKDTATSLIPVPEQMDAFFYLGRKYTKANEAMYKEAEIPSEDTIRWCTQSNEEKRKCDSWSIASKGSVECIEASSAEQCITKILKGECDAVTLDGGYLHTAGACGLVPAMQEIYDADACKQTKTSTKGRYYAVAVVKTSDKDITIDTLKGLKSCHTALGRNAGYNIPAGLIYNRTGICDLGAFFKQSCIPGDDVGSNRCELCGGNDKTKCLPNNKEPYYGYDGALRCVIEVGNVAFVKQTTPLDLIGNENSPAWAKGFKKEDFQLLCLDGTRKPVDKYEECHLASVPSHAVATTAERRQAVVRILQAQQDDFGSNAGKDAAFQMFVSQEKRDQLFKDNTKCLGVIKDKTMEDYLGKEYMEAMTGLSKCRKSGLLAACTFHTCKLQ